MSIRVASFAACALVAVAIVAPATLGQRSETVELGSSALQLRPSCPQACEAVGRVSGYQVLSEGRRHVYRAPFDGKVVSWSIVLSKPRASQIKFFDEFYGTPPRARLSVLRPGGRNRFRLTGQSQTVNLTEYLGQRPVFALERPLTVKRGYFVAVTVPTWAPSFATGLSRDNAWRASRPKSKCRDVKRKSAHQRRKSIVAYGCVYRTARLLYTATVVRTKSPSDGQR